MSGSWRADWWLGTISLSQGCFQMSQGCGLWSDDALNGSYPRLGHNFLFAHHTNGSSMSAAMLASVENYFRLACDSGTACGVTVARSDSVDRKIMSRSSCQFS